MFDCLCTPSITEGKRLPPLSLPALQVQKSIQDVFVKITDFPPGALHFTVMMSSIHKPLIWIMKVSFNWKKRREWTSNWPSAILEQPWTPSAEVKLHSGLQAWWGCYRAPHNEFHIEKVVLRITSLLLWRKGIITATSSNISSHMTQNEQEKKNRKPFLQILRYTCLSCPQ